MYYWWGYGSSIYTTGVGLYYGYSYGLGSCWTCYGKGYSYYHPVDLAVAGLLILVGLVGFVLTFRAQRRQRAKLASS
jgi:hypothetical protein